MVYKTKGTCSQMISVEVEDDIITYVEFLGGCNGNTKGIASLVTGMDVHEAIRRLQGITCGPRKTSCPDQLSIALRQCIGE